MDTVIPQNCPCGLKPTKGSYSSVAPLEPTHTAVQDPVKVRAKQRSGGLHGWSGLGSRTLGINNGETVQRNGGTRSPALSAHLGITITSGSQQGFLPAWSGSA